MGIPVIFLSPNERHRLQYVECQPVAALADYVECFWVVRDRSRQRTPDRILPDGCPEWIIHAGDAFERENAGRWVRQPKSFLAGTLSRPLLVRGGKHVCTLGIRFRPGAAAVLLDIDLSRTADREVDLAPLLKEGATALVAAVCGARTTRQMLSAAQDCLLKIATPRLQRVPKSRVAVDRLRASQGRIRVDALAKSHGVARRTLERWFQRELGISPKQYARIVRLNSVLASMSATERSRIVEVALDAGYFDEAHLLLDFRALAGRKPRSGRETDGKLARHFTRPERLRALLQELS